MGDRAIVSLRLRLGVFAPTVGGVRPAAPEKPPSETGGTLTVPAAGFRDPLLVTPGMIDTNVPVQTIARLTESWTDGCGRIRERFDRCLPKR